jgi:hypothetical protein
MDIFLIPLFTTEDDRGLRAAAAIHVTHTERAEYEGAWSEKTTLGHMYYG